MPSTVTNEDKQLHEDFIRSLLSQHLNLKLLEITRFIGGANGIVYRLSVTENNPAPVKVSPATQPATLPLPIGTTTLVIRLSDPAAKLNEAVRVQNEVAMMSLIRDATQSITPSLVPAVYGWGKSVLGPSSEDYGPGWVLMEHLPGLPVEPAWESLDKDTQKHLLEQIGTVLKCIQEYKLLATIAGFGGLNFDGNGRITTGPTSIDGGGPCGTLAELYTEYFQTMLKSADKCDIVKGWHDTDLRSRVDTFASKGLQPLLEKVGTIRPTLVHGDLNLHNLLFDPSTARLTAVLDYDFGHIASPADEFFYSFVALGGLFVGPHDACDHGMVDLRTCMLHGFPPDAADRTPGEVPWPTAIAFDAALKASGASKPSDMKEIDTLSAVYWFMQNLSPQEFFIAKWRAKKSQEYLEKRRVAQQKELEGYLDAWGF